MTSPMLERRHRGHRAPDQDQRAGASRRRPRDTSSSAGPRAAGPARGRACTLTFVDDDLPSWRPASCNIGKAARSRPGTATRRTPSSSGTVTSVASEVDGYRGATLTVVVAGRRVRAAPEHEHRVVHQHPPTGHRVAPVQEAGLLRDDRPADGPVKYALRNDTALGLIDEIAQRTGRDWCIRRHRFSMWSAATGSAPGAQPVSTMVDDVIAFSARQVGDGDTKVTVRGWDPVAQSAPRRAPPTTPTSRAGFDAPTGAGTDVHPGRRPRGDASQPERRDRATALARARDRPRHRHGRSAVHRADGPGRRVTVGGAGPSNGNYYVREVTNTWMERQRDHPVRGRRPHPVQLSDPRRRVPACGAPGSPSGSSTTSRTPTGWVASASRSPPRPTRPPPRGRACWPRRRRGPRPVRAAGGRRRGAHRLRGRRRDAARGAGRAVRDKSTTPTAAPWTRTAPSSRAP